MENRNEPMKFEKWRIANARFLNNVNRDVVIGDYANYFKSFVPASVEERIEAEYPLVDNDGFSKASTRLANNQVKSLQQAARFGASLTSPIDLEKLAAEVFDIICHNMPPNGKEPEIRDKILARIKQRISSVDNSVAFAEWIRTNAEPNSEGGTWSYLTESDKYEDKTTTELYSIFLNQKDKK